MNPTASRFARVALLTVCAAAAGLVPAAASASPTLLGVYKDWSAYKTGSGGSETCYALSQPKTTLPDHVNRDPIFFLLSDWPARKAKAEPEVVPGYPYKDGSKVTAQVGSDKFTFFTKNEDKAGNAWVEAKTDEARLVRAMRRGSQMIVTGTSSRGTLTHDTYSLSGVSAALSKIHKACGL
jgi:hypothetical protein